MPLLSPFLGALFLVVFDQKIGYKIAWQRCEQGIDLAGVEYKALPSGLHSEKNDVVYFVHSEYIGVSAFIQAAADAEHRNAQFVAVGALVEQHGDFDIPWEHVESLQQLAQKVIENADDHNVLDSFWAAKGLPSSTRAREDDLGVQRTGQSTASLEDLTVQMTGQSITSLNDSTTQSTGLSTVSLEDSTIQNSRQSTASLNDSILQTTEQSDAFPNDPNTHDPLKSLSSTLDTLGPLIFPLYRYALLGQRILIIGHPPVKRNCELVHHLSLLSKSETTLPTRRALYSVGIADMTALSEASHWTACTTDSILKDKTKLHDIVVELSINGSLRTWPRISDSSGNEIRATPRDLKHYLALHRHLGALRQSDKYKDDTEDDQAALLIDDPWSHYTVPTTLPELIEPYPWSSIAQRSLSWWITVDEEDLELEQALGQVTPDAATLISYFNSLTRSITDGIRSIAEANQPDIQSSALRQVGLDRWSESDHHFFETMATHLTGKEVRVIDEPVHLCGIRVC